MHFDVPTALSLAPGLLEAAITSLWIALLSALVATVSGFGVEMLRRIGKIQDRVLTGVLDFIRVTPILAQLYFLYFVLPLYGVNLPTYVIGVLCLGLHYGAYLAEVFKAGIDSVPKGQIEAARALGLGPLHVVAFVLAPQVVRFAIPPIGNYLISIFKATPYLAVITVPEILGRAFDDASDSFRYVEPLTDAGLIFLVLCLAIGFLVRRTERRLQSPQRRIA